MQKKKKKEIQNKFKKKRIGQLRIKEYDNTSEIYYLY